jgi:hypothetical protein
MATLAIGLLGGIGTLLTAVLPIITKGTSDISSGLLSKLGFKPVSLETIQSQEDKIQKDVSEKFIKMEDSLRRALHTKYMVESYIPDSLKTRSEGKITNIDDVYTRFDELIQDEFLKELILGKDKFAGFLKYRQPYLRIMENFLDLFKRLKSLKDQIEKLIEQALKINIEKLDIPPEQASIKGGDYSSFIKSEISILYEEFLKGYSDYNQYVDRLSNFYRLIQGKGFNELDVFKVARTSISKYVGEDKGVLVWSTKDNVKEGNEIIDELQKNSPAISFCLSGYSSIIDTWLGQLKGNKGVVITSLRPIIENEKKQITDIIGENINITSDLAALRDNLEEYNKKDKLDDAKLTIQSLKSKKKRFEAINDKLDILESRLNSYANTINNSREATISFQKCLRSITSIPSSSAPIGSNVSMGSSVGPSSTGMPLPSAPDANIQSKLASINFASVTDKDEAMEKITAFREILNTDLSDYLRGVYNDYETAKNMSIMMNSASDLFGASRVKIFGTIDNRPVNNIINKVVKN